MATGNREIPKKALRSTRLFDIYKRTAFVGEYAWWRVRGKPRPKVPHLVKQRTLTEVAQNYKLEVLVETGTNLGHMIGVQKDHFREIYSIELDEWLAARARRKFANNPNIHLFQGDSGKVLPTIIPAIKEELECIYRHPVRDHVLLIDDARWFDGRNDYLSVEELREHAEREYPGSV